MNENLKKFLDLIASNKELEAKVLACNEMSEEKGKQTIIELAKENGIELTAADFEKPAEPASGELNDDELDAVAGGAGEDSGICFCTGAGGGGGKTEGEIFGCACVGYGQGGDAKKNHFNCVCLLGGTGDGSIHF